MFTWPHWNTWGIGRILESYANPQLYLWFAKLSWILRSPLCYMRLFKQGKSTLLLRTDSDSRLSSNWPIPSHLPILPNLKHLLLHHATCFYEDNRGPIRSFENILRRWWTEKFMSNNFKTGRSHFVKVSVLTRHVELVGCLLKKEGSSAPQGPGPPSYALAYG